MDAATETVVKTIEVIKSDDVVNENSNSKIYIHEDHDFKSRPETVYYCNNGKHKQPLELGKFVYNQKNASN